MHSKKVEMYGSYLSAGDLQLNLPAISTHQHRKLLTHAVQDSQAVVLRQRRQKVLQDVSLASAAGNLLQLSDDLCLILVRQSGRGQDGREFGVLLEDFTEGAEGFGCLFEAGGFGSGSVL